MKSEQERGIESLKDALKFLFMAIEEIATADSNQNGKIGWLEGLSLVKNVGMKIPRILKQIPDIREEWKDLTQAELDELVRWFTEEFDLPGLEHDRIEKVIKIGARAIVANYNTYRELKAVLVA